MNNLLKYFFLISILCLSIFASGQLNYRHGYIITKDNDTIQGKIEDAGSSRNTKYCLFKENTKRKGIKYYPADIKAYKMKDDKYYVSKEVILKGSSRQVFMEVLIDGKVNLYHYLKGKKTSFYIEKENSGQMTGLTNEKISELYKPLPDSPVSYSTDYYLTNEAYLDTLSYVFRDDKKIQRELHKVPYYHKSLMRITKSYINHLCRGENCLRYEKDLKKYTPKLGVYQGIQVSHVSFRPWGPPTAMITSDAIMAYPVGVFINIPIPVVHEGISFQFEAARQFIDFTQDVSLATVNKIDLYSKALSFPLSFKYELTSNRLSPSISLGREFTFMKKDNLSKANLLKNESGWFGEVGLDYKVHKKLSVFANLRVESKEHYLGSYFDYSVRFPNRNYRPYEQYMPIQEFIKARTEYATLYFGIRF